MKIIICCLILLSLLLSGCASAPTPTETINPETGGLQISFDFNRQSGYATNQYAIWITDGENKHVKTVYATSFTANGGYKNRPDALVEWVNSSGLSSGAVVSDAVTGATPGSGTASYVWNFTDSEGNKVPDGVYRYYIEGTIRWANSKLYTGTVEVGGAAVELNPMSILDYNESPDHGKLNDDSPEVNMITNVNVKYEPPRG